jgi:hypothetical protein
MPLPTLKIAELRLGAIDRLRTAVANANAELPGSQPALKGLYIPAHRFGKIRIERAPFVVVVAKRDGGVGVSHHIPRIELVGELHINGLLACARSGAVDLDTKAEQLAEAICLVLLEDSSFLELVGGDVKQQPVLFDDFPASGDKGNEFDCVTFQIQLELGMGQKFYQPQAGVPLSRIDTKLALGDEAESIPAQSLVVKQQINIP